MRRIIVSNNHNENMIADRTALTHELRSISALVARRIAWFAEAGDIVVIPSDLSPIMKAYIAEMVGYRPGEVQFVCPDWDDTEVRPLGAAELASAEFVDRIRTAMNGYDDWELLPYYYDRPTVHLMRELGLRKCGNFTPFICEGGAEVLNDKRAFRGLAAARGVAIADGEICIAREELVSAVGRLIPATGSVIIKQDRHASAEGNLIITQKDELGGEGASEVLRPEGGRSLEQTVTDAWARLAYRDQAALIVETYYPAEAILYAEFDIDAAHRRVKLLNWGEQRMKPVFRGFVIPPALPPYRSAHFIAGATELARLSCDLGFAGLMDVDGIVTREGIVYNEINARTGGCSHIHHIAQRLLGADYGDRAVIAAFNRIRSPGIEETIALLSQSGLGFQRESEQGIVVTTGDEQMRVVEYLAIAGNRSDALRIETEFESLMKVRSSNAA